MIRRSGVTHAVGEVQNSVKVRPLSLDQFLEMMQPGFAFARISDGGFFCITGRKGYNCDGSPYSQEQADCLIAMIKDESITHGITSIALHVTKAAEWLAENKLDVKWYDADVMNKASDAGELWPFISFLKEKRSLLVAGDHLRDLKGFPITSHVVCHSVRAFEEVDELEDEINFRVAREEPDCVLLSAGQGASPTLVSRLHASFPNLILIDTGSLFDPYVGVLSRSGHKKRGRVEYKRLGHLNFHDNIESWS